MKNDFKKEPKPSNQNGLNNEEVAEEKTAGQLVKNISKYHINTFYMASLSSLNSSFMEKPDNSERPQSQQMIIESTGLVLGRKDKESNQLQNGMSMSSLEERKKGKKDDQDDDLMEDIIDESPGLGEKIANYYSVIEKNSYISDHKSFPKKA